VLGQFVTPIIADARTFTDMNGVWFRDKEAVEYLQENNVMVGYGDGTFHPDQPINRAEFLKIVFKAKSETEPVGTHCFADVDAAAWYAPYVCAAARRGIVSGYPDGTYKPDRTINTAEAIKIMVSAYKNSMESVPGKPWYEPYVDYLDANDILKKNSYALQTDVTRVRAADLLWRTIRFENDRIVPNLSRGCGTAAPSTPPSSITVGGIERHFLLTIPRGYQFHDPSPLIVAFHGRTNSPTQVREYYKLDQEATNAIIAYPEAQKKANGSYTWYDPLSAKAIPDTAYFDALVELIATNYCIDMDKLYTVGHSLGAWMANSTACLRGEFVRASASVGGDSVLTPCTGPVAALIAHNKKDTLAPFSGSEKVRDQRVTLNHCAATSAATEPSTLNCVRYSGCDENPVVFCPHTIDRDPYVGYYPHLWPQNMAHDIWQFFTNLP
jgi:polyhydroxybutyrate depolymerase